MDFASLQMLFSVNGVSVVNKSEIAFTANAYKSAVYLDCLFRLYYLDCPFAEQLVISLRCLFLTLVKGSDCPRYLTNCLITFQFICHYMQYYVVRIKFSNGWFDMVIHTAYFGSTERSN